ncbi:hypothetical protein HPP92_014916 [Vanilla planifolia]|uniref:Uncharacterized protein n=1 Tax=Vanilla planifolia TaxID=51239 RepID=A0A835QRX7_VANPL|nr:hypothetical protein HPP92_014916 [Vanilla planifolia]
MASPVSRTQRRIPVPQRKPLQSKNPPANPADVGHFPERRNRIASRDGKENRELAAARGRTKQLHPEGGQSASATLEMDAAFERWTREAWRRLQELLLSEKDIRRVAMAKQRRSSAVNPP